MTSSSTIHIPWRQQFGGSLLGLGIRGVIRTLDCRIAYHDRSFDNRLPEYDGPSIGVFWHEYLAVLLGLWAHSSVTILVSQHRDAEWLNQAAERLGFSVVRGSTRRGGSKAILQLRQHCKTKTLGIAPDGPLGPRRRMSLGPIFLASLFEMPIVPVGVGYRRPWRAQTWDRFALCKPFSRARVICGPKIYVPRRMSRDDMEDHRVIVEQNLSLLTAQAEDWAENAYNIRGQMRLHRHRLIDDHAPLFRFNDPQTPRAAA